MKHKTLNIRISQALKHKLLVDSMSKSTSISNYARDILTSYFEEQSEGMNYELFKKQEEEKLFNSNQFIFLVTWIFEKRNNSFDNNEKRVLKTLKETTLDIIKNDNFPSELKNEFEKVYVELTSFIIEYGTNNSYFKFCLSNQNNSFNYQLLINYIQKKAFESVVTF